LSSEYKIDLENGIVRTHFSGTIRSRDVAAMASRLARDPGFKPEFSELVTFAEDCDLHLSFLDFGALMPVDPFSPTSKRALVVPSKGVLYGHVRMFETSRGNPPNIRIVETMHEAVAWLGEKHRRAS
jgi:hypothetical protein